MRAVLIDVGGTLWPTTWPSLARDRAERVDRLVTACGMNEREAADVIARISLDAHPPGERQLTETIVREALDAVTPKRLISPASVWTAMCLPPTGRVEPFLGAGELLAGLRGAGRRVVIVSNVMWRDELAHRRDFDALGWSQYVDAYVSSLEVGWRKPHAAFFDAALLAAGCDAGACAMVGDSETNDIEPAKARGMLTIRVAIEEPAPTATVADHVCTSLYEVAKVLAAPDPG